MENNNEIKNIRIGTNCSKCGMPFCICKKENPLQRVSYLDAMKMLEKEIEKPSEDKLHNNIIYDEDYAGGSTSFVRLALVEQFLKKITR